MLLMIAVALIAETPTQTVMPTWMAGCWEQKTGDNWVEECWTRARAGQMMGSSRTGKGDVLGWYEHVRITAEADGTTYCALPKGQAGGCFKATKATDTEIVFENDAHDYPQRIRYWREGKDLAAEISLKDGSKAQQWRYAPLSN